MIFTPYEYAHWLSLSTDNQHSHRCLMASRPSSRRAWRAAKPEIARTRLLEGEPGRFGREMVLASSCVLGVGAVARTTLAS
jgi:hypothetical protein